MTLIVVFNLLSFLHPLSNNGSVAQRIERRFPKPCVAGSIPAGAAAYTSSKDKGYSDFCSLVLFHEKGELVTDWSPLVY